MLTENGTWISDDTTPEAAAIQAEIWRRMPPERKHQIAAELSENVRQIAAQGVKSRHPDYTDAQIRLAVIKLAIGEQLFQEAYPDAEIQP